MSKQRVPDGYQKLHSTYAATAVRAGGDGVSAELEVLDHFEVVAVVAPELHGGDRAFLDESIAPRDLLTLNKLIGGEQPDGQAVRWRAASLL